KVIDQAGYALVTSNDELNKSEENHAKKALWLFWWSLAWSLPVVFAHWFGYMHEPWGIWVVFICATVLQPTSAITYYIGAFKALRRREANMDVLISVGVIGGYTYAVLATFLPERFPGGGME